MPDRSYSFFEPNRPNLESARALPVEIVSTGRETRSAPSYRWDNERHRRARYDIFQCGLSGSGVFEYRRGGETRRERIEAGRMFIASWQEPFAYWFEGREPWEFLWITLAGDFADRVAAELGRTTPVLGVPAGSAPLAILSSLQDRLAGPVAPDRYALSCVGYEFLVQLAKLADGGMEDEKGRFVAEARVFAARRIASADLSSLARHFGYAEKYFIGYFKERAGVTPARFLTEERLRFASSLLAGTRKSVAEIAEESGFADAGYFSKVFRRCRGVSPTEYRESSSGARTGELLVI